jgi:hypothetical protein
LITIIAYLRYDLNEAKGKQLSIATRKYVSKHIPPPYPFHGLVREKNIMLSQQTSRVIQKRTSSISFGLMKARTN